MKRKLYLILILTLPLWWVWNQAGQPSLGQMADWLSRSAQNAMTGVNW